MTTRNLKQSREASWIKAAAPCLVCCAVLLAREPECGNIAALARMARAKSTAQLAAEKLKAGNDYRAMVVFASRSLELQPRSRRLATLLLGLIPRDDAQQTVWMTLGDSLCGTEPLSDMRSLGRLGGNLPRDLAEAVLVVPGRLPDYVAYSVTSVQDPHSDYALQMQRVCGAEHSAFVRAVDGLEPESKDRFLKHVFDPRRCHALALPESE